MFRYPYELTDEKLLTDDKNDLKRATFYDSCDSNRQFTASACSSIMSSSSNLNSCLLGQVEKKNPYALVGDNNSLFNCNLGFNSTANVKTPTTILSNDLKFNSVHTLGNKNPNLHHQKFNSLNHKVDSCLLNVINLPDKILSDLLAVKSDLCGNKFELKINDVRFVGHPVLLSSKNNFQQTDKLGTSSHLNKGSNLFCAHFKLLFFLFLDLNFFSFF